jgi:predicted N-formylglutamate amidohydrolase
MAFPQVGLDRLLGDADPPAMEVVNGDLPSPFVLVCEHAGNAVPTALRNLGIAAEHMESHIAVDIGAGALARRVAELLGAPLVLQRYSRLVVDCNRPAAAADCIPEVSDGVVVHGNRGLGAAARERRMAEIHAPFHTAIARLLDRRGGNGILASVHSFTPQLGGGRRRPWHVGVCFRRGAFGEAFLRAVRAADPNLNVGRNEPYPVSDLGDYTIPAHAEGRGIRHVLIEVRNDLLDAGRKERWARLIAAALERAAAEFSHEERAGAA